MRKKLITITTTVLIIGTIGVVLANNKAKIDKAAKPVIEKAVIPVKVHEVKIDSFNTSFNLTGTTSPAKEVKIASEVQGKLVSLYISNGDFVRAGQTIALLDASVFNAQLNSVKASLAKAELDIARFARLVEMGGATAMQLESAKVQRDALLAERKQVLEQMAHMQIKAPFSGRIENVSVEKGSFVTYGTVLADLLDVSSLKIHIYLSEKQALDSKQGQKVSITSVVLSQPKTGAIAMISDKADASGKFLAEVHFNNDKEKLKAGMLADVSFSTELVETGLSVPASAIVGSTKEARVFVVNGDHVEIHSIKAGIVTSDKIQVLEGLHPGDQVVISGQMNLENGALVSLIK